MLRSQLILKSQVWKLISDNFQQKSIFEIGLFWPHLHATEVLTHTPRQPLYACSKQRKYEIQISNNQGCKRYETLLAYINNAV